LLQESRSRFTRDFTGPLYDVVFPEPDDKGALRSPGVVSFGGRLFLVVMFERTTATYAALLALDSNCKVSSVLPVAGVEFFPGNTRCFEGEVRSDGKVTSGPHYVADLSDKEPTFRERLDGGM
jgi:hypothetical protein